MTSTVSAPRQNQDLQHHLPVIIAALAGAVAVGLVWIATAWATANPIHETSVIRPEKGDFKVSYVVQDTESSSSGATLEGVSAIEFHANYVVVRQRDGKGRVFFNQRTRELSWGQ